MSEKNNDTIYTAKDIEQYFAGTLTSEARHALEKAALDDPFLAEAMEGYQQVPVQQWMPQLTALKEDIQKGSVPARVIPMRRGSFRLMKVAAAVILILGGTTLTWVLTRDKQDDQAKEQPIAQNIPQTKQETPAPLVDSMNSTLSPASGNQTQADNEKKSRQAANPDPKNKPAQLSGDLSKGTVATDDQKIVLADEQAVSKPTVSPVVIPPSPADVKSSPVASGTKDVITANEWAKEAMPQKKNEQVEQNISNRSQALTRVFKAQVVGPDNTPLPFSNVNVKSANIGTYADVKGNFRLVAADSLLTVEIRSVGYQPVTYTLNSNQPMNKITLAEEGLTNAAPGRKSKAIDNAGAAVPMLRKPSLVKDPATNAEPADGWDNYNTYIANNLELPDELIKSGKHGEFSISFDVKPDGKVANVIADQADCPNCNELARQLVEQGPQWKLKKGEKAKTTIKVKY